MKNFFWVILVTVAALAGGMVAFESTAAEIKGGTTSAKGKESVEADYPSGKNPWKGDQLAERRVEYKKEIEALMSLPASEVKAHPAARDFLGYPSVENPPRITKKVQIDTKVPQWHSTGLYAMPGAKIKVELPQQAVTEKWKVRIGCHKDLLWRDKITTWKRVPQITRNFTVTTTKTEAANAFGGLIYIEVPPKAAAGTLVATIEGGIAAPYFVLGKTSEAEWKKIRTAPAPWAELESRGLIFTVPSDAIRSLDRPTEVMQHWQKVAEAQDDLAGTAASRIRPERVVLDRQISAGYLHSGYPIMGPLKVVKDVVEIEKVKKGSWGIFHELGHNHQSSAWTFNGAGEVTCNLFTLYCLEKVCNQPRLSHQSMKSAKRMERMNQYFKEGNFEEWKKEPFLALSMYEQMIGAFGWEPFKKVFRTYKKISKEELPKTDDEKRDLWMVLFSKEVNKNLGPFFEKWKVPTSQAARDSIEKLPAWMPENG